MVLQRNGAAFSVGGKELKIGGKVFANDKSAYMGLYGIVTEIRTDDDRETKNDTPLSLSKGYIFGYQSILPTKR